MADNIKITQRLIAVYVISATAKLCPQVDASETLRSRYEFPVSLTTALLTCNIPKKSKRLQLVEATLALLAKDTESTPLLELIKSGKEIQPKIVREFFGPPAKKSAQPGTYMAPVYKAKQETHDMDTGDYAYFNEWIEKLEDKLTLGQKILLDDIADKKVISAGDYKHCPFYNNQKGIQFVVDSINRLSTGKKKGAPRYGPDKNIVKFVIAQKTYNFGSHTTTNEEKKYYIKKKVMVRN